MKNLKKTKSKILKTTFGNNCKIIEPVNIYGSKIGNNVFIGPFVEIQKNSRIGSGSRIQSHSFVCEKVTIGKKCFISHGVMFTNDFMRNGRIQRNPRLFKKTKIGDRVIIGSNSTILPVNISNNIVVGAGSVVTKDLKIKGIYAGAPAKLIRRL